MYDQWNRKIDYLRVSVTDRCNLRCVYCMPEEGVQPVPHTDILSYEEILRVCRCAAAIGIRKIKLTGGEPLVRRGISELVRGIKGIDGIEQVTLTTNGILLGEQAEQLKAAGLDAVNVSLDTLDPAQFQRITRRPGLDRVLDSLGAALGAGLRVKINCVPTREYQQVQQVALLAKDRPIDVRFIEMMPIGMGGQFEGIGNDEVRRMLEAQFGTLRPCEGVLGNGPAVYAALEGFAGRIGFISAVSHRFCESCNRVRMTAEGFLKLCLQFDRGVDLRELLRGGADDAAVAEAMRAAIAQKPAHHRFGEEVLEHTELHRMVQIGG